MRWTVTIPLRLESVSNKRWHWTRKHRYMKATRAAAIMVPRCELPCHVTVVRIAPRALDGHDNLASSAKGLVDGIADRLGVKDNDPRVTWHYAQRKGKPKEYGVEVVILESPAEALKAMGGE